MQKDAGFYFVLVPGCQIRGTSYERKQENDTPRGVCLQRKTAVIDGGKRIYLFKNGHVYVRFIVENGKTDHKYIGSDQPDYSGKKGTYVQ